MRMYVTALLACAVIAESAAWKNPRQSDFRAVRQLRGRDTPRVPITERLNTASFYFDDQVDSAYQQEYFRLQKLCEGLGADYARCAVQNFRAFSKQVAAVRRSPSVASNPIGWLDVVLEIDHDGILGYRIDFRPAGGAKSVSWLEVGDSGYGIKVPGVRLRGNWIQLFEAGLPADSWINGASPSFRASAGSIEGSIVSLPQLQATFPDGTTRLLQPGNYVIQRIRGTEVFFRREVPSDMPCDDRAVESPPVMPPSLRTDAANLFSEAGEPLFAGVYGRGC